ncbi:MAG: hypothetical protein ACW98U_08900 [Candidatus Thorarchaeota archaeon]
MTNCEECQRYGYSRTNQVAHPCVLCGEMRCDDHMIWVPAHEVDRPFDENQALLKLMKHKSQGGWYGFCGRPSHVPRGVPYRAGQDKDGGKMISPILDHEKKLGLEMFRGWETGVIEDGFEKHWEPKHYALSCSIATVMILFANLHATQKGSPELLDSIYNSAILTFGDKKKTFFGGTKDEFLKAAGDSPEVQTLVEYACSRCAVIPCLNRQASFYDQKLFKKLAQNPELLFPEEES